MKFVTEFERSEREDAATDRERRQELRERFGEPAARPRFGYLNRTSESRVIVIDDLLNEEQSFSLMDEFAYQNMQRWQDSQLRKTGTMKIYVASSWRNILQPAIVSMLRSAGQEVYDFRNPPGAAGFGWSKIDAYWQLWTPQQYRDALNHPIAKSGFESDIKALRECDACVLVLPSGRSASWEFGYALGQGKKGAVVMFDKCEPELMYLGNPILTNPDELLDWVNFKG